MSETLARSLPDDLEERVLELLDGPSELRDAGLRALAEAHPAHGPQILGWLQTAEAVAAEPVPGDVFGDLRILGLLGRGGMGAVYRAHDDKLARDVAVKVLPGAVAHEPGRVARFLREARIAAQLRHPHIVAIHRVGEEGGRPFMAMELVAGTSLDRALANLRAGAVSVDAVDGAAWARAIIAAEPARAAPALASSHAEVVARLAAAIAEALAHAHSQGVVHRDLKPANIMVRFDGSPVLLDFGLARAATGTRLTAVGQVMGTPEYFAPEQLAHEPGEPDARTDVWAFGVMLYQMLTLALPFGAYGPQLVARIQNADPLALRRRGVLVPRDLETICFTCLEKDPAKRYRSAVELLADLRAFLEFRPVHARPIGRVGRAWRWARRNRLAATGAVVAGFAAIGTPSGIAVVQAAARHEVEQEKAARELANTELQATNVRLAAETARKEGALQDARQRAAEASLQLAQRLLQRGQWQSAFDGFDQAQALGHQDTFAIAVGRIEALDGMGELEDVGDLLMDEDKRALPPGQRATVDLMAGELLAGRMTNATAGMDRIRQAEASGHLGPADRTYARAMLAGSLPEARDLFQAVLAIDPGHRRAAVHLLPLDAMVGTREDLGATAVRLRALFPNDALGPLASALHPIFQRDLAALDRVCESMRHAGLAKPAATLRRIGGLFASEEWSQSMPQGPAIASASAKSLSLAMEAWGLISQAGLRMGFHPKVTEAVKATLAVMLPLASGGRAKETDLQKLAAIWPDGMWELLDVHRVNFSPHVSFAACRRARERGSVFGRLVNEALWDGVVLSVEIQVLSEFVLRGRVPDAPPWSAELRAEAKAVLHRAAGSRSIEASQVGALALVAIDQRESDLAVELALRHHRMLAPEARGEAAQWLSQALEERGAFVWAREITAGFGPDIKYDLAKGRQRRCEDAIRKLAKTLDSMPPGR